MNKFEPVILGNYMGAYSIARSFYEQYHVKSTLVCKFETWITSTSKIVNTYVNPDLGAHNLVETLIEYAVKNKGTQKILFSCSEWNTTYILKNKKELERYYIIPNISFEVFSNIVSKKNFYSICERLNISYPKTIIVNKNNYKDTVIPYDYPIVGKASDAEKYIHCTFENKKKVFIIFSKNELDIILDNLYNSTYDDDFIIQSFVSGDDCNMRTLTCYCDKKSNVVFSALGQPILEENNPESIGNYAAIINRYDEKILNDAKKFLKEVGYIGFANFDIKYDNDGNYYFFEINPRLGRSNYYITASGINYSKMIVDEYIYNLPFNNEIICKGKALFSIVPFSVIKKYCKNKDLIKEAKELKKEGKMFYPAYCKEDMNIKRKIYFNLTLFNQNIKFKKFYNK